MGQYANRDRAVQARTRLAQARLLLQARKPSTARDGLVIVLKVTGACSLKCSYCYSPPEQVGEAIPLELGVKVLDDAAIARSGPLVVDLHGGEPTLGFPTVRDLVTTVRERPYGDRVRFNLQTNAATVTRAQARFMVEHGIGVGVSLDGRGARNGLRLDHSGKSSYERATQGIRVLQSEGVRIGLLCILTRCNVGHEVELLELCCDLGVATLVCNDLALAGRALHNRALSLSPTECAGASKRVLAWMVDRNPQLRAPVYERRLSEMVRKLLGLFDPMSAVCGRSPCGIGVETVSVRADGNVYPCDWLVGQSEFVMGNLRQNSLTEVLRSDDVLRDLRVRHTERVEECRDCDWNHVCSGGCVCRNILEYGKDFGLHVVSPMCGYYRAMYPYIRSLLDEGVDPRHIAYVEKGYAPYLAPSRLGA